MRIYDTLSNQEKELDFSKKVKIYLCGVTVYDESHVGHARTIIVFDVLRRYIESKKIPVEIIQNFTDVDDKIINRAKKENIPPLELSTKYIKDYHEGFDRLNVRRASRYPKATEHIEDMQNLIKNLVEYNIAYKAKNGVYFAVEKFSDYGKLSKNTDGLQSGSRIEIDEEKQNPLDFALWKFSDSEPSWESPWGRGRPGWHIECSAMSLKYLGESFDIHGGGRDLIFPHHENEIAQSEAHTGKKFAKIWMHVGMVTVNGEKMSKSLGNIKSVKYLIQNWSPNVIRLFCIAAHYSKPIDYSEELLKEHETNWNKTRLVYYKLIQSKDNTKGMVDIAQFKKEFDDALKDNLNTHLALSAFYRLVTYCLSLDKITRPISKEIIPVFEEMLDILGLHIQKIPDEEKSQIESLITQRDELRNQKKYEDSDRIRAELASKGIELKDEAGKTIWIKSEII